MSHFSVGVITKNGAEEEVAEALGPFHEFECTGCNDEYIKEISTYEDHFASYTNSKTRLYRSVFDENVTHDYYDEPDIFWRMPTEEEMSLISDRNSRNNLRWKSKDWDGDGNNYKKIFEMTPDFYIDEVPTPSLTSLLEYVVDYEGIDDDAIIKVGETPDVDGDCKYGYIVVDDDNNVIDIIKRTNPDAKWDWWTVGGRWNDLLINKDGIICNSAQLCSLDFDAMIERSKKSAYDTYLDVAERWMNKDEDVTLEEAHEIYAFFSLHLKEYEDAAKRAGKRIDDYVLEFGPNHPMRKMYETRLINILYIYGLVGRNTWRLDRAFESDPPLSTYAVLWDGKWLSKGEMGWFGISSNDECDWAEQCWLLYEKEIPRDLHLTIVDCHI